VGEREPSLPIPLVALLFVALAVSTPDIVPVVIAALAERDGMMIDCCLKRMVVCPVLQAFLFAHMASPAISVEHLASRNARNVVPSILPAPLAISPILSLHYLAVLPLCF
jgi:hypothetical protein